MSTILDFLSNILFNVLFSDIGTVLLMPIVICQCIAEKITTAVTIQETELTGLKNFLFHPENKSLRRHLAVFGTDLFPEWLFIYGEKGVGKSHLATCVNEEMEKNNMLCCIMNYSAFMNQSKNDESFTNTVKGNNCLIIDDIEEVLEGDSIEQCLFMVDLKELEFCNIDLILLSKVPAEEFHFSTDLGFFIEDPIELKAPVLKQKIRHVKRCLRKNHLHISKENIMEIAQMKTMGQVKERLNDLLPNH